MPETLISVPSAVARLSAAMTRWRRRAESAWRPLRHGLGSVASRWSCGFARMAADRAGVRADGGHAEVHRAVLADDGDRLVDAGALGGGQAGRGRL